MTSINESLDSYRDIYYSSSKFTSNDDRMLVIDDWIDATNDWKCSGIEGYQRWRSLIKSELDATEELSKTTDADDVLQASNLIAHSSAFKALVNPNISKHPITAVNKYFLLPKLKGQKGKPKSVKVDVVADAGRSWIRLSRWAS